MTSVARRVPPGLMRLILGHVALHSALAGMRMALPLLGLRLGYGTAAVGILLALFALAQMIIALPAGRLVDRYGVRLPLSCCAAAAATGIGLAAASQAFPVLCISALCSGGAVAVSMIAMQHHAGRSAQSDAELRQAFSWISVAPAVSLFIGPLLTGVLIDTAGFGAAFVALALMPVGTWFAARSIADHAEPAHAGGQRRSAWSLWGIPEFRRLLLLNWLMTACWDLHAFMVPVLAHERGIQASVIGALLASFAVAATISRLALPAIAGRVAEWILIAGVVTVAGALVAAYPLLPGVVAMGACSFALGMLLGSVQPSVMTILHKVIPSERRAGALAMRLMMINASAIAMPMLFGAAGAWITASGVFFATGLVVGVGGGVALGLVRRRVRDGA